jgi:hypothetical protein
MHAKAGAAGRASKARFEDILPRCRAAGLLVLVVAALAYSVAKP